MRCLWLTLADPEPQHNGQYVYSGGLIDSVAATGSGSSSRATSVRRASVYRMAAAPSLPREPKLPWPSTSGYRIDHG